MRPCRGWLVYGIRAAITNSCGRLYSNATTDTVCAADANCDGAVTVQDFLAYMQLYAVADLRADMDGSGTVEVGDFLSYLGVYAAAC